MKCGGSKKYCCGCNFSTFPCCRVLENNRLLTFSFAWYPNLFHCVFIGERKRKILCSRESDRVVVSDQRCHGTARPAVITEPCNTECELRFVLANSPTYSTYVKQSTHLSSLGPLQNTDIHHPWCRWHIARKSECTAQCGLGYRTLEIFCAKISRTDGKTQKVDDRYCSGQRKPDDKEGCHGDCDPGGWEYSPWSEVRLL